MFHRSIKTPDSRLKLFIKKVALNITKLTENTCAGVFFDKGSSQHSASLVKKDLGAGVFL